MTYWLRIIVSKSWMYINSKNFDNRILVGVEIKFLKNLDDKALSKLNYC